VLLCEDPSTPIFISNTLHALARLGCYQPDFFACLCARALPQAADFNPLDVTRLLGALTISRHRDAALLDALSDETRYKAAQFNENNKAAVRRALESAGHKDPFDGFCF
jgi:hypothetical protein